MILGISVTIVVMSSVIISLLICCKKRNYRQRSCVINVPKENLFNQLGKQKFTPPPSSIDKASNLTLCIWKNAKESFLCWCKVLSIYYNQLHFIREKTKLFLSKKSIIFYCCQSNIEKWINKCLKILIQRNPVWATLVINVTERRNPCLLYVIQVISQLAPLGFRMKPVFADEINFFCISINLRWIWLHIFWEFCVINWMWCFLP